MKTLRILSITVLILSSFNMAFSQSNAYEIELRPNSGLFPNPNEQVID